jgi:hypothetical protein
MLAAFNYTRREGHQLRWARAKRQPPRPLYGLLVLDIGPSRRDAHQLISRRFIGDLPVQVNNFELVGNRQLGFVRART